MTFQFSLLVGLSLVLLPNGHDRDLTCHNVFDVIPDISGKSPHDLTLDKERFTIYTVLVDEQSVRSTEQNQPNEESVVTQGTLVPMVERAFRLLDLLSVTEEGLTMSDLARALTMSKSSIHGLLKTLEHNEAIEQREDRRFVLGPRIYDLAQTYIQRAGLRHFALPAMRRLASSTGETVCLGRIEQKGVRIIECVVDEGGASCLHITVWKGMRIPLLVGSTGACVLASWPRPERERYLHMHQLPRFTERSITDPQRFLARVDEVAQTGICIEREEYLEGVHAVAAPIYGMGGTLVALLWIVGFASRLKNEALDCAAEQLRKEALIISQGLNMKS